jgi:hypothetical protein
MGLLSVGGLTLSVEREEMVHSREFGLQISGIFGSGRGLEWQARDDVNAVSLQLLDLVRVVREQHDLKDPQALKDLGRYQIVALVGFVTEKQVGVDGIVSLVLEIVRPQLIRQSDTAALLP